MLQNRNSVLPHSLGGNVHRGVPLQPHITSIDAEWSASDKMDMELRYLPARKNAPVEALTTPKPFLSVVLLP